MIKKIKILPRALVEYLITDGGTNVIDRDTTTPWALISIFGVTDDNDRKPNVLITKEIEDSNILRNLGCHYHHNSCFADVTQDEYNRAKDIIYLENLLFDEERAKAIIEFIDSVKDKVERLFVHCDAGVSRSGGVGLFATRYLGLDESNYLKENPYIYPNRWVVGTLSKVSGLHDDYETFWKQVDRLGIAS